MTMIPMSRMYDGTNNYDVSTRWSSVNIRITTTNQPPETTCKDNGCSAVLETQPTTSVDHNDVQ
jgi:hypothetical protein